MSTRRRYIFVDVLCSLAIALAMAAHALNDFDVLSRLTEAEFTAVRFLTRAATPSFIFMFGMMLELVYARRISTSGIPGCRFSFTPPPCFRTVWSDRQAWLSWTLDGGLEIAFIDAHRHVLVCGGLPFRSGPTG